MPQPGAHPLLAARDHDVRDLVGRVDDAETLDGVDDQEAVADHLADALEVGEVAGAEVDQAHADGDDRAGQLRTEVAGRDAAVVGLDPDRRERAERLRRPDRGEGDARELGGR